MKTIPLSPVDHLFTGPLSQPITFAFHYSSRLDPDALRKSLDWTLGHFPLLRSQLEKISDTDYGFRITGDGLSFECQESDARPDSASIEAFIMSVRSGEGEPLTKIRLILYPEKSTLAVSISHAIVDGFSYFHFLSSWVRLHKGERILPPSSDRDGLFPAPASVTKSITEKA